MLTRLLSARLILLLSFLTFALPAPAQPLEDLDSFVGEVLDAFEVPGVSIAVVKDGEVVLTKGYGLRSMETREPVTAETLFGIASNSKAFTATALGILVEQGKLAWDKPVVDYMPWFRLSDPYATANLTVRDLMVHRSGMSLGAGDLLWWPETDFESGEIVRRLRHLPLATSFRNSTDYDNVLFITAGELIKEVTGKTWEEFVAEHILTPVGMRGTKIGPHAAFEVEDHATPHAPVDGVVRPVPPYMGENANAAAGLYSNAVDMARWLVVQLDSGRTRPADRIFTPETTRQLWGLVNSIPIRPFPPELKVLEPNFNGYALGFVVKDYRGHKVVTHTGGLPGFVSQVTMIPDVKLGIAVLTNQESGAAFTVLTQHILDAYMGYSDVDWLRIYHGRVQASQERIAAIEAEIAARRDSTASPSLPLARYVGTYRDPWYGDVVVTQAGEGLEIRFEHTPWLVGTLSHWQHDTFIARWYDRAVRADAFVTFSLNPEGRIVSVRMEAVSPATDFSFDFHDLDLKPVD